MKRIAAFFLLLILFAGCSDNNNDSINDSKEVDDTITTINKQEHNIQLVDNEDLKMTLLNSHHEQYENARGQDKIDLTIKLENKTSHTLEFLIDELALDGVKTINEKTFFDDNEIGPNETKELMLTTFTEAELDDIDLNFKEHIKGTVLYSDYERNRLIIEFSEYIQ